METLVDLTKTDHSPVSSLPPIVSCPQNSTCSFIVPGADSQPGTQLSWRLATGAEDGSITQPSGLTIDPTTGTVTWNTTGRALNSLWAAQIVVEKRDASAQLLTKVAVDFIIRIVPPGDPPVIDPDPVPGQPPVCNTTVPVFVGDTVNFVVSASDPNVVDLVTLNSGGLPATATTSPSLPASGNPISVTFSWIPTAADIGTHVVNFTATDSGGLQAFCPVTLVVEAQRDLGPRVPYGLTAQWGQVVPGFLNAVLAWRHPGQQRDGTNSDRVVKYRLYRRTFQLDIDCDFRFGFIPTNCHIPRSFELVGEIPGDKLGAVLTDLEDLANVFDGWEFAVSAVDDTGRESPKSNTVAVLPWEGSNRPPLAAPRQPIIFVPGYKGSAQTWSAAAAKLHELYGWTEAQIEVTETGARLIQIGNMYRFTFPNNDGDLRDQGKQIGYVLDKVLPSVTDSPKKAILFAHSFGGIASRSYLQLIQRGQRNRVSRLVTYGTPHPGIDAAALIDQRAEDLTKAIELGACALHVPLPYFGTFGTLFDPVDLLEEVIELGIISFIDPTTKAVQDAHPNSNLMRSISDFRANPLPTPATDGIAYVSLRGRLSLLTDPIVAAASISGFSACDPIGVLANAIAVETSLRDTDLLFDSTQQDLSALSGINVSRSQIQTFERNPVFHAVAPSLIVEGGDYIGVLMGVGYPVLSIRVHSPVTIAVVDPQGQFVTPEIIAIPGATYTMTGGVEIPMPLQGDYRIIPIPDPAADPNSTFSIDVSVNGGTRVIAVNHRIQDIPQDGYIVNVAPQLADEDNDAIPDINDLCPGTSNGEAINADGCSVAQLVPCAGPASGGKWKTHGDYVSAVAREAEKFVAAGLITQAQKDAIVAAAAQSKCGGK